MKTTNNSKMLKFSTFIIYLCCLLMLLTACGGEGNLSTESNKNSRTAESIKLKDASTDVQAVYKSNCMSCHAIDLSGKMGDATNLQQVHTRLSFEEIIDKLNNGGQTMPSFQDRLSVEEIEGLAGWLAKQ